MPTDTLFDLGNADESSSRDLQTVPGLHALMALKGVGAGRAIGLAKAFGSAESFNASSPEARRRVAGIALDGRVVVADFAWPSAIHTIGYFDDGYPPALRALADPPAILWVRGTITTTRPGLAVVGTRHPTAWGQSMAAAVALEAVEAGFSVVSGLALGIDITAHRAAVDAGGHTIAVLGSAVDSISPKKHRADAEKIVESGGCLLSELPPGTPATARTLVARNRIQTGLSMAAVVVQCGETSGTMATARFAFKQGRPVAVPLPPETERGNEEYAGSESLLERGARPLSSRDDLRHLLDELS
jgi:DNA processing protein